MEYISINGQNRLLGEVHISGAKNAALAIIPAALAAAGECIIDNLPCIADVLNLSEAIRGLGIPCEQREPGTLVVNASTLKNYTISSDLVNNTRASYYLWGVLLGRLGQAEIPLPGGCDFGSRPYDYHLKGFEALGATCEQEHGVVKLQADRLIGAPINLNFPSVGATINIMIAAVFAEGTTTINNAAQEPHVVDTANFLNKMGAKINGAGTNVIRIKGTSGRPLYGGEYTVIPDQIETGTYMIAAAITGGDVTVKNVIPKHMETVTAKLREMNCEVIEHEDTIRVISNGELKICDLKTATYPGFPTDLQPQMAALLCIADGTGMITETVWENRFQYIGELRRLGANMSAEGRSAVIKGPCSYTGARVNASDLRAGAALMIAGLAAKGETIINNIQHLDRGYENFEIKLRQLGADINRVERSE